MALASSSHDHLWWSSTGALLNLIQSGPVDASAKKQIDGSLDWILNGTSSFHGPSDGSRKLLSDSKTVSFKGKKFAIEPLLRPATIKLSALLVRETSSA